MFVATAWSWFVITSRKGGFISELKGTTGKKTKGRATTARSLLTDVNKTFLFVLIDHWFLLSLGLFLTSILRRYLSGAWGTVIAHLRLLSLFFLLFGHFRLRLPLPVFFFLLPSVGILYTWPIIIVLAPNGYCNGEGRRIKHEILYIWYSVSCLYLGFLCWGVPYYSRLAFTDQAFTKTYVEWLHMMEEFRRGSWGWWFYLNIAFAA